MKASVEENVITAILHQHVAIPGVMAPNQTINTTKLPGVKLKWDPSIGLIWKIKNREGFFPTSTVAVVETQLGTLWPEKEKAKAA